MSRTKQAPPAPAGEPDLITIAQIAAMLACSKSTIWRWLSEGRDFPRPIVLGPQCYRWVREEIEKWLSERPRTRAGKVRPA